MIDWGKYARQLEVQKAWSLGWWCRSCETLSEEPDCGRDGGPTCPRCANADVERFQVQPWDDLPAVGHWLDEERA